MNVKEHEEFSATEGDFFHPATDFDNSLTYERVRFPDRRYSFYPSDALQCPRRMILEMLGIQPTNPSGSQNQQNIFDVGNMVEDVTLTNLRRLNGYVDDQFKGGFSFGEPLERTVADPDGVKYKSYLRPYCSLRADAFFIDDEGIVQGNKGQIYIVEVKSTKDTGFNSFRRKDYNGSYNITFYGARDCPKKDNYAQLQLYLYYVNLVAPEHLKTDRGILHYQNKNTGQVKSWIVYYHPEFVEDILQRWQETYQYVCDGKLPPIEYDAFVNKDNTGFQKSKKVGRYSKKTCWRCCYWDADNNPIPCKYADGCYQLNGHKGFGDLEQDRE